MKKVLLSAVAVMFALAAAAQNKAIDALAEKYVDREGFTVVNVDGQALKNMSGMLAGSNGTIKFDENAPEIEVGELLDNIVSLTVLVLERGDKAFAEEVHSAVSSKQYSPMISFNEEGSNIRVLSSDIKRGKLRGNQEIVVTVVDEDDVVLVRVIGKIDTETVSKMVSSMQKS